MLDKMTAIGVQVGYFLSRTLSIVLTILVCYYVYILIQNVRSFIKRNKQFAAIPGPPRFNYLLGNIPLATLKNLFQDIQQIHIMYLKLVTSLIGFTVLYCEDKLYRLWLGTERVLVVWGPETVEAILSNSFLLQKSPQYYFLQPWLGTGLLTASGQKWRSRRKLLVPAFHFKILHDFVPVFNEQALVMVEKLKEVSRKSEYFNVIPYVTACTLDIICETIMGVSIRAQKNHQNDYCQTISRVGELFLERLTSPLFWPDFIYFRLKRGQNFQESIKHLHDFTRKVIKDRKREMLGLESEKTYEKSKHYIGTIEGDKDTPRRKAFMDILLDHHINNSSNFTEEDIREEVDTFMFEGHDTTAMGMSWILYLLGHHPEIQEKLAAEVDSLFEEVLAESSEDTPVTVDLNRIRELKYLECVIKEGLRLYPSVPFIGRTVSEDLQVKGYVIPKGTTVFCFIYQLHRDPTIFTNPEVFDPDRFLPENANHRHPFAFVPFSAGPRNCIGQKFAMSELKIVLAHLIRNFTFKSIDARDKIVFNMEMVLRPKTPLNVQVFERQH